MKALVRKGARDMNIRKVASLLLLTCAFRGTSQDADTGATHAGYTPAISGGIGYVHHVDGGITTLEPQIDPILLLPLGSHLLVESRTDFTGFFQRRHGTRGDFTGAIFKTVEFAQMDWLADSHLIVVAGKYLLPFGSSSERLQPIWIRNLQDLPITLSIGTQASGAGDGGMLRGVIAQNASMSVQYSTYFSAHSGINQLAASRTSGADASAYFTNHHIELGSSYQRYLEGHHINSVGVYLWWEPNLTPLDMRAEYDRNFNGEGYWLEGAYLLSQMPVANALFQNLQVVGRMQQFHPLHGGGNGLPTLNTKRVDFGLNYYLRDNWRILASYGRQFDSSQNRNIWNVGFTYRFLWPLWPERK